MIDFWIFPLSTIWGAYQNQGLQKKTQKISTHLLTVLTTCVILHAEQRKQHISPSGEIFLI